MPTPILPWFVDPLIWIEIFRLSWNAGGFDFETDLTCGYEYLISRP
jgi:hypothetical protein